MSGTFDKTPSVSIPAQKASANLVVSTPIKGSGAALSNADNALANVALYKWSGTKHTLLESTFGTGPQMIPAQMGLARPGDALKGAHLGSRIVAVLPPKYGYGTAGESQLQVTGKDTLVWVIDLIQQFSATQSASGTQVSNGGGKLPTVTAEAGQAPVISVPKNSPAVEAVGHHADQGHRAQAGQRRNRGRAVRRLHLADRQGVQHDLAVLRISRTESRSASSSAAA